MKNYSLLQGLAGVYLEDSYVLSISEVPDRFVFSLDAVLTPESPRYEPPKPDEQYCYALGLLVFDQVTAVRWVTRSPQQFTDADGAVDLGNIDSLSYDGDVYTAEGDWGCVEIHAMAEPRFDFD